MHLCSQTLYLHEAQNPVGVLTSLSKESEPD